MQRVLHYEPGFITRHRDDLQRLASHLCEAKPEEVVGLARKYHRMKDLAQRHGIQLPECPAEWVCQYEKPSSRVVLADDIVIRGTIASRNIEHYATMHESRASFMSLVVDKDRVIRHFPILNNPRRLTTEAAQDFVVDLAKGLETLPRPCDLDHPEFVIEWDSSINDLVAALRELGTLVPTGTVYAHEHGIRAWTLIPTPGRQIATSLVPGGLGSTLRLRVFHDERDGKARIFPHLVTYVRRRDLATAWNLSPEAHDILRALAESHSCDATLAYFRAANHLAEAAAGVFLLTQLHSPSARISVGTLDTERAFGPRLGRTIITHIESLLTNAQNIVPSAQEAKPYPAWSSETSRRLRAALENDPDLPATMQVRPTLVSQLGSIMATLQGRLEADAEHALAKGTPAERVAMRLLDGFAQQELCDLLKHWGKSETIPDEALAAAIDIADSAGAIVAKLGTVDDITGRYYTYGEGSGTTCLEELERDLRAAFWEAQMIFDDREATATPQARYQFALGFHAIPFEKFLVFALEDLVLPDELRRRSPLQRAINCDGDCENHVVKELWLEAAMHGHYFDLELTPNDRPHLSDWVKERGLVTRRGTKLAPNLSVPQRVSDAAGLIAGRIGLISYIHATTPRMPAAAKGIAPVIVAVTSCFEDRRYAVALRGTLLDFYDPNRRLCPWGDRSPERKSVGTTIPLWKRIELATATDFPTQPHQLDYLTSHIRKIREATNEMRHKPGLYRNRNAIAKQLRTHFETNVRGPARIAYRQQLSELLERTESVQPPTGNAQYFLARLEWLATVTHALWDVLADFIGLAWELQTHRGDRLWLSRYERYRKRVHDGLALAKQQVALAPNHGVALGPAQFDIDLSRFVGGARLDLEATRDVLYRYRAGFNALKALYDTHCASPTKFNTDLNTFLPSPSPPRVYQVRVDQRKSSKPASISPAMVQTWVESAAAEYSRAAGERGLEADIDGGDAARICPMTLDGAIRMLQFAKGRATNGLREKVFAGHPDDYTGASHQPVRDGYKLLERLANESFQQHGEGDDDASIILVSEAVVNHAGGVGELEKRIGLAFKEVHVAVKSEGVEKRLYRAVAPGVNGGPSPPTPTNA